MNLIRERSESALRDDPAVAVELELFALAIRRSGPRPEEEARRDGRRLERAVRGATRLSGDRHRRGDGDVADDDLAALAAELDAHVAALARRRHAVRIDGDASGERVAQLPEVAEVAALEARANELGGADGRPCAAMTPRQAFETGACHCAAVIACGQPTRAMAWQPSDVIGRWHALQMRICALYDAARPPAAGGGAMPTTERHSLMRQASRKAMLCICSSGCPPVLRRKAPAPRSSVLSRRTRIPGGVSPSGLTMRASEALLRCFMRLPCSCSTSGCAFCAVAAVQPERILFPSELGSLPPYCAEQRRSSAAGIPGKTGAHVLPPPASSMREPNVLRCGAALHAEAT